MQSRSPGYAFAILLSALTIFGSLLIFDIGRGVERATIAVETSSAEPRASGIVDELSLIAQQQAANWTLLSVGTAFVGTVVSAFGLIYLAQTVRAATDANRLNTETGQSQSRAYLSVSNAEHLRSFQKVRDREYASDQFWLTFVNSGQTPAINVSYYCEADLTLETQENRLPGYRRVVSHEYVTGIASGATCTFKASCFGITLWFNRLEQALLTVDMDTELASYPMVTITGSVFYEDVFSGTYRSDFCFIYRGDPLKRYPTERSPLEHLQGPVPAFVRIDRRPPSLNTEE